MKIILSIVIPVFNGARTICQTLDSIAIQLIDGVEIVISDNASTDQIFPIIARYQAQYPEIVYFRNEVNVGFDSNVNLGIRRARGNYVWLLGDDDEIAEGGITEVLSIIEKNGNLSAFFVNYSLYDRNTGLCFEERALNISTDVYCESSDKFLSVVTIFPNFLSSNIIKRARWIQIDPSKYVGTNWIQFGMLLESVAGGTAYCISTPFVRNKGIDYDGPNEFNKNGVAVRVLLNLLDILDMQPNASYSEKSINKSKMQAYKFLPRKIISSRRNGLRLTFDLFKGLNYHFGNNITYWLRDAPLLCMPQKMHLLIWKLYKIPVFNEVFWKISSKFKRK